MAQGSKLYGKGATLSEKMFLDQAASLFFELGQKIKELAYEVQSEHPLELPDVMLSFNRELKKASEPLFHNGFLYQDMWVNTNIKFREDNGLLTDKDKELNRAFLEEKARQKSINSDKSAIQDHSIPLSIHNASMSDNNNTPPPLEAHEEAAVAITDNTTPMDTVAPLQPKKEKTVTVLPGGDVITVLPSSITVVANKPMMTPAVSTVIISKEKTKKRKKGEGKEIVATDTKQRKLEEFVRRKQ